MDNEVMELIEELYGMVSEAWSVPLGNDKCIVEREKILEILDDIKTALPVELAEAKRLVSARNESINNAKREAEGIRNQAEERARQLVDEQEIVRIARTKSSELMAETEAKVNQLRQASAQFCSQSLQDTEAAISAALTATDAAISAALEKVQATRSGVQQALGGKPVPAPAAPAAPAENQPHITFETDAEGE